MDPWPLPSHYSETTLALFIANLSLPSTEKALNNEGEKEQREGRREGGVKGGGAENTALHLTTQLCAKT